MIAMGVQSDPDELRALKTRVRDSIRTFGNRQFTADLGRLIEVENDYHAARGLNRHGRAMNRWRTRKGVSDFHGGRYAAYSSPVTLTPFGRRSRRHAAFRAEVARRSVAGVGFGAVTASAGFLPSAGRVPELWRRRDPTRDVLGMPPRTRRAVQSLCNRHATYAHSRLKRAGAAVSRSAAAFLT